MKGENDNLLTGPADTFHPSAAALFLPATLLSGAYLALLVWLAIAGREDSALIDLVTIMLAVGAPLPVALAALRYVTIRLRPLPHALHLHPGFPAKEPIAVPYALIRAMRVSRGLFGWIDGSGTLELDLVTGSTLSARNLSDPDTAMVVIERLAHPGSTQSSVPSGDGGRPATAANGH
jgi:hypothetical protein